MQKIVSREPKYDEVLSQVPNWKVPVEIKKDVKKFFEEYQIGKITDYTPQDSTLESYVYYLKMAFEFLNKPVKKITEKDIDKFSNALMKNEIKSARSGHPNLSESVKIKIRRTLSQFLEWKKSKVNIRSLKVKVRQKMKEPEYLSEAEIDKLYKSCKNAEERYLIAVLYSSGARASEFYNIHYEDFQLPKGKDNFVRLMLKEEFSKSKGRTINLYYKNTIEAVSDFLEQRLKEGINPKDPVWKMSPIATIKRINSFGVIKTKVKKKDGTIEVRYVGRKVLNRWLHMHLFRHSCATALVHKLNRQQLCIYFGWNFRSPMPDVYINREGVNMTDVDEKMTQTELGELKAELNKQKLENKDLKADMAIFKEQVLMELKKKYKIQLKEEIGMEE